MNGFSNPHLPRFTLGNTVITQGAKATLSEDDVFSGLARHMSGDWGELEDEDKAANESALRSGGRLLSKYHSLSAQPFYIITEADRSYTTVLLPEEY